jgi:hypothetical protein
MPQESPSAADQNPISIEKKAPARVGIGTKLTSLVMASVTLTAVVIGGASYLTASKELHEVEEQKILALTEVRKSTIEDYLDSIRQDIRTLASSETVQQANLQFSAAWAGLGEKQTEKLKQAYISGNPHPDGRKEDLDLAKDGSQYSDIHGQFHPLVQAVSQRTRICGHIYPRSRRKPCLFGPQAAGLRNKSRRRRL